MACTAQRCCLSLIHIFVGPAPKPAPPWGPVYTDRACVVFGEGTLELRAWMRAHGVRRTTDERTPEDHIGLMLALMSYLARNQPDDLDEFLQIHLLTWSSHFLDQLVEAADHPFYEGLARLAKASLEGIQHCLLYTSNISSNASNKQEPSASFLVRGRTSLRGR